MDVAAVRVPEAAERLGIDGVEVYLMIRRGELRAGKGPDGAVYVPVDALREYEAKRAGAAG